MSHLKQLCCLALLGMLFVAVPVQAAMEIQCVKVAEAPILDGSDRDAVWQKVKPVAIKDQASQKTILLRSIHTDDRVFFVAIFSDSAQNSLHKPWSWNDATKTYDTAAHREDTFVFKWNMMDHDVSLSNFSDDTYKADVWYWKANRTNPAGYADDKYQLLGDEPTKKSSELVSASGKKRYLSRKSDKGDSAYKEYTPNAYEGDIVDRYPARTPSGSRADVQAKGQWQGGIWVVEFSRALSTGNDDDVVLDLASGSSPLFGVSMFSLYGRPHDPNSPNLYGRGRVSEPLRLKFQ
jgi:hypothetical protein